MKKVPLGKLIKFIRGITFTPQELVIPYSEGAVACLRTKNIQTDLDLSDIIAVPHSLVKREEQFVQVNDMLISSANSFELVGKTVFVPELDFQATAGGFISIVRPLQRVIYPRYLFNWLMSPLTQLKIRYCGRKTTNISNLDREQFLNLEIPLPALDEQRHIADILDTVDSIRRSRQEALEQIDALIKSQFIEMFGDPVTNPKGWDVKRLAELIKVRSSKRVYQREQATYGVPFLRVSDLTNKIINGGNSCELYISEDLYESFLKRDLVPQPGDILVTSRGTLGLCYIVNESDRFYFQDGMISWLDNRKGKIDSVYLSFLFHNDEIGRQIEQVSAGSTVRYLSLGNLENLKVLIPPISLQNEFAAFVEQADKSKFAMQQQLQEIETLKAALMQQYFSQQ